jgi:repressor LexA
MVNKMVNRMNRELTGRQAGVLRALEEFILRQGHAPTIRQLAGSLRIASPSAVFKHVLSLERKGYVVRDGGELRLAGRAPAIERQVRVPLLGPVPAGSPKEIFDLPGEAVDVPDWMVGRRRGNVFCLKVEGKSMIDAYIDDGDRVVLERTDTASAGEMIVARLDDGSVTLKRLRRDKDRFLLVPENPDFKPIEVKALRVLGRVIGVLRKY